MRKSFQESIYLHMSFRQSPFLYKCVDNFVRHISLTQPDLKGLQASKHDLRAKSYFIDITTEHFSL